MSPEGPTRRNGAQPVLATRVVTAAVLVFGSGIAFGAEPLVIPRERPHDPQLGQALGREWQPFDSRQRLSLTDEVDSGFSNSRPGDARRRLHFALPRILQHSAAPEETTSNGRTEGAKSVRSDNVEDQMAESQPMVTPIPLQWRNDAFELIPTEWRINWVLIDDVTNRPASPGPGALNSEDRGRPWVPPSFAPVQPGPSVSIDPRWLDLRQATAPPPVPR